MSLQVHSRRQSAQCLRRLHKNGIINVEMMHFSRRKKGRANECTTSLIVVIAQ